MKDLPCITTIATTTACGNCLTLKGIITSVTIKEEEEDVFHDCSKDANDAAGCHISNAFSYIDSCCVCREHTRDVWRCIVLNGTSESDTIDAFEGDDKLFGEGDDHILDGGNGNDAEYMVETEMMRLRILNDTPYSTDRIYGGSENDNITVGIDYARGNFYYIYGEAGSDYIKVVSSSAFINGGIDDDTIDWTGYECVVTGDARRR